MITVCDQLEAMTEIADSFDVAAQGLADALNDMLSRGTTADATVADVEAAKEQVLGEIAALRSLVADIRHQEDTRLTQIMRIREAAALRSMEKEFLNADYGSLLVK